MSQRVGEVFVFEAEPPDTCELCGAFEELRPYGPNGERICIACADKDPETTARQMDRHMADTQLDILHLPAPITTRRRRDGGRFDKEGDR